jgi:hypothetical protein
LWYLKKPVDFKRFRVISLTEMTGCVKNPHSSTVPNFVGEVFSGT